ncbi:centromere/kinetochore protein zw10 homolog [Daphnia carinata]|uniref:centromere/kinetochore protein zw10 homolog n=1 Tax=Daphnia carinata TaxID=120202 RepID=UPI00257C80C7|nr:centromere/kinetochore protein zw10 homolog [Daphnia carinata]
MASLVSEILMSAGQLEKRDLQTELNKVKNKIDDAKFQVSKFVEQHYQDFDPLLVHSRELAETSSKLSEEVQQLVEKAETELKFQLDSSTNEMNSLGSQINAAKLQVQLLERVSQLHSILEKLKKMSVEDIAYAEAIAEAESILNDAEDHIDTELDIWRGVKFEIEKNKDNLLKHLEDSWNNEIQWTKKDTLIQLKLNADKLKDVFQGLAIIGQLDRPLCEWSSRLYDEILVPLTKADTVIQFEDDLELMEGQRPITELVELERAVKNISLTFQHLNKHLEFKLNDVLVLHLIGKQVAIDFVKLFVKTCLKPTLPASSSLLSSPEYRASLEMVVRLENEMVEIGFLTEKIIEEFADNVDLFFADKQCLESLSRARQLMCLDLHDTICLKDNIEQTMVEEDERNSAETAHLWKMLSEGGMEIKWSPFRFPPCQISRSTQDLIEMLTNLVQEAGLSSATERSSARLLFTVRSICELYVSVVPEYHRDALEKLPFHAAVAHNNGMYLAHSILTLGTGHLIKLVQQNGVPLMDLVGKFRQLAAHIFLEHMKSQRDQLLAILKEAGFNRLENESRLPSSVEKAGRQVLHQLRNLQKIWQPVLPNEVYLRAIGTLSNSVLEELLLRITTMEDIPAAAALQLTDQCQNFINTLPLLFGPIDAEDSEGKKEMLALVMQHIHLWSRFEELKHLLGAGLRDIEGRWSSGKGPLAVHFAADEVKQMIRALFQNTDHRAATLSRIK